MDYNPPVGGGAGDPYIDANPGSGIEGSPVPAASIEYPQREIVAAITAAGLTPDNGELEQLASAIQLGTLGAAAAAGTADAITAAFDPTIAALIDGMAVCVRASAANGTSAPTFTPAVGTIADKAIVKGAGGALVAGDIAGAGHWIVLRYDQALDKWLLQNPATGVTAQQFASSAETQAGGLTTKSVTPLGLAESTLAGVGQTWQPVTRALATTYYNTTGRPIVLSLSYTFNSGIMYINVDGNVAAQGGGSGGALMHLSAVIPHGASYEITRTGTNTIYATSELR